MESLILADCVATVTVEGLLQEQRTKLPQSLTSISARSRLARSLTPLFSELNNAPVEPFGS